MLCPESSLQHPVSSSPLSHSPACRFWEAREECTYVPLPLDLKGCWVTACLSPEQSPRTPKHGAFLLWKWRSRGNLSPPVQLPTLRSCFWGKARGHDFSPWSPVESSELSPWSWSSFRSLGLERQQHPAQLSLMRGRPVWP